MNKTCIEILILDRIQFARKRSQEHTMSISFNQIIPSMKAARASTETHLRPANEQKKAAAAASTTQRTKLHYRMVKTMR